MSLRELTQPSPIVNIGVSSDRSATALGRAMLTYHLTCSAFRDPEPVLEPHHRDTATVRGHHLPSARSLSIALSNSALSNSASANSFLNLVFSTRSSLSSFTSAAFIPP